MSHRFINRLSEGEQISEIYLVNEKQLRSNRNGNLYLQVRLSDRTGSLVGMLWNANETVFGSFENGDYVRATGATQFYQGGLQMILNKVERADTSQIDESDYVTLGESQVSSLQARVGELLREMDNYPLRNLAECFLIDEAFMSMFSACPAGVKNHHAYRGGLLEHTLGVMEMAKLTAPRYPDVDPDMLMMGAFLHDVGKIEELTYERELGYADAGQMIGHLIQGVSILDGKIRETERLTDETFPIELAMRLKHMLISHHGQLEFGSPKVPMTLEAVALHYLDSLDSKLHNFKKLMDESANTQSPWTSYFPGIQRKLYRTGNDGRTEEQGS
jgi:3'-5' exoribonuclease